MAFNITYILIACVGLVVLMTAGYWYVRRLRRMVHEIDSIPPSGFTLDDLRSLRREGKLTEMEYQRASALVVKTQSAQLLAATPVTKPGDQRGRVV